jgi:predicted nucleic acid-binding protein
MKAVFDTNILVDYLNGVGKARKELKRYPEKLISVVTQIEVLVGVEGDEEAAVRSFLSTFEVRELSKDIAEVAVQIRKETRMKVPDAVVYATAKVESCLIISRNTKDFREEWPDVRVPYQFE